MKTVVLLLSLLFAKDLSLSAAFCLPQLQSHRYLQKILRATSDENLIVQSSTTAEESSSSPPPIISESNADAKAVNAPAEPSLAPVIENIIRQPANTSFFMCSACKAAYLVADRAISGRGSRVRCKICEKDWFQTMDRTLKTDAVHVLETMSSKSMADLKRIIADKNWPRYSRAPKFGIFVGNLPYTYEEKDLIDLFAEYGVTQVSLVRDNEGQSKGFAFIEVSSEEDAEQVIREMHHFYTDPTRRLTVRLAQPQGAEKRAPAGARPGGGGGGGAPGGKVWSGGNNRPSGGSGAREY